MVCAFFSCSDNDDQPVDLTIKPVIPEATLSLAVQTDAKAKTKGGFIQEENALWDSQVKTMTAVVFNNGAYNESNVPVGSLAAVFSRSYETGDVSQQIEGSDLPAGKVHILLLANLEQSIINQLLANAATTTANQRLTYDQVQALTSNLTAENESKGLTMSSNLIQVELVPGLNYIGFKENTTVPVEYTPEGCVAGTEIWGKGAIDLVRSVASIRVVSIVFPKYPDPENKDFENISFTLKEVFVVNVKSTACLNGDEVDPTNLDGGYASTYYLAPTNYKDETGALKFGSATGYDNLFATLSFGEGGSTLTADNTGNGSWANEETMAKMISPCYVYPNQNGQTDVDANKNHTVLVLKADYTSSLGPQKDRYYAVIVNDTRLGGSVSGDPGKTNVRIQRNTKYNIELQVLGSGSDKPFDPAAFAHVAAQIKVANWNVIEIDQPVD